jgi:hypothetical protein
VHLYVLLSYLSNHAHTHTRTLVEYKSKTTTQKNKQDVKHVFKASEIKYSATKPFYAPSTKKSEQMRAKAQKSIQVRSAV